MNEKVMKIKEILMERFGAAKILADSKLEIIKKIAEAEAFDKIRAAAGNNWEKVKASRAYQLLDEKTARFSGLQKKSALGTVAVLALAGIMAVAPVAELPYYQAQQEATLLAAQAEKAEEAQKAEKASEDAQWLISIGGKMVLAVGSEEEARGVFEGVKNHYLGDNQDPNATVVFDREFRWDPYDYKEAHGDPAWEMNVDEAVAYILKGKDAVPYLNVTTTQTLTTTESIPYTTTYEDSADLFKGQTKVKTAGVCGSKDVTAQVTKINGVVVATNVLSEQVTSQPKDQVSLRGTTSYSGYVATSGSGILANPMSHMEISSGYGASRGGGTRRHAGIDLRNPKGTPFAAVADGTVIFAGWSGSYGNIVKVDHGGGLQTYYAHCDSMCVSAGQKVSKGQTLGTVGSTGNATGNVLHFEVRVNGVAQNPVNYL